MIQIRTLDAEQALVHLSALTVLLQDAVDSGASIGFLPPLSADDAQIYWHEVIEDLKHHNKLLLVAFQDEQVVGAVQLALATKFNGLHRAEVQKLFVHRQARNQGLGRMLMAALEDSARQLGRSLLVLDTRQGDAAEQLYSKIGYQLAGAIPMYARSADGTLHTTLFFYKQLSE